MAICCSDCDGRYSIIHYIHRIMAYTLQDKMYNGSIICTVPQLMKNVQCTHADVQYSRTRVRTYNVTSCKCTCATRAKIMQAQVS